VTKSEWDETFASHSFGTFRHTLVNEERGFNYLTIGVWNPQSATGRSFSQLAADSASHLYYRRIGSLAWFTATHENGTIIDLTQLKETSDGYIRADWFMGQQLGDGDYELEARTICTPHDPTLPEEFKQGKTPTALRGVIDRTRPSLLGLPKPNGVEPLYPGDTIQFEFSEAINRESPLTFVVQVTIVPQTNLSGHENMNTVLDSVRNSQDLAIRCEDRAVAVAFVPDSVNYLMLLSSREIKISVVGVEDINGNPADPSKSIYNTVTFASPSTLRMGSASVGFELLWEQTDSATNLENMTAVKGDIVAATGLPSSRVIVNSHQQVPDDDSMWASWVTLRPPATMADMGDYTALTAYYRLRSQLGNLNILTVSAPDLFSAHGDTAAVSTSHRGSTPINTNSPTNSENPTILQTESPSQVPSRVNPRLAWIVAFEVGSPRNIPVADHQVLVGVPQNPLLRLPSNLPVPLRPPAFPQPPLILLMQIPVPVPVVAQVCLQAAVAHHTVKMITRVCLHATAPRSSRVIPQPEMTKLLEPRTNS
jgi:hypothetical protein